MARILLDADEAQVMIGSVPIVEEELFARGDEPLRIDTDAMIAIDHDHFGVTVWIDRMVRETDLVSTARRIDHVFFIEIEQKARAYRVVHATTQFTFVLRQLNTRFSSMVIKHSSLRFRRNIPQ